MEKQLEYTTRAGVIAEIYLQNMELEITSGEVDQTKLDLRWQAEDKMQLEDVITIEYMEDENRLKIDEKKSNIKDAQLKLTIPPESKVVAENTNGSTELSQVSGRHIIRSENGSIFARNIDGEIQLKNENGSISLQNSEGKFKLKSENGSLKAKAVSGELKLSNVNGASKVVQCSGKLKIKSENGVIRVLQAGCEKANISSVNAPIYFEFASIKHGKFEFKNENGKTQILVPEDLPYDIEAATKYGSLHVGIKGDYDSETEERTKKIQMTQGAGTVEIEVANKLGGITIIPSGKGFIRRHIDLSFITETLDNVIEKIPPEHR
ncbi:MAG: DUF4097 family beta strand repeat-containing protein, partial [Candidatus Cloacimonadota bacterium]|nr:DUF4097 family beta strand repeat-containing protein [Candidatus Cloacimonadota bacterium]